MRVQEKRNIDTEHPYSLYTLGFLYISVNFGTVFQIFGVNISYPFTFLFIVAYLYENKLRVKIQKGDDLKIIKVFCGWLLYALIQFVWSTNSSLFIESYLVLLINVFLSCATILVVTNRYEFLFALRSATLAVWINIIAAGWEYFTGKIIVQQRYLLANRQYIAGLIGNFNDFCTFMYLGCVLFLILLFFAKQRAEQLYCIAGIACALLIIFFDAARGAIFSVICFVPCFFVFWAIDGKRISALTTKMIVFTMALAVVLFITAVIYKNGIEGTLAFLDRSGGGDTKSDIGRFQMIIKCLKATLYTVGFGVGAGQSILVCGGINVHNFYIEILCEYGAFACVFVTYFSFFVPIKRNIEVPAYINAITQSFAVTFIIAAVTSSSVNKMRMLWICLFLMYLLKKKIFNREIT